MASCTSDKGGSTSNQPALGSMGSPAFRRTFSLQKLKILVSSFWDYVIFDWSEKAESRHVLMPV